VAPDLVAKVRAAADTLGYVPTLPRAPWPQARAAMWPCSSHAVQSPCLWTCWRHSAERSGTSRFRTLIGITHYDPSEEESLLREQLLHRPAGLIVTGLERHDTTRQLIAQSGVPCVHLMTTEAPQGAHCVGFSQMDAGRDMARHLISKGYRRIALAAAQLDRADPGRLQGWRSACRRPVCMTKSGVAQPSPSSLGLGARMFEQIMGQTPPVDAIFFCHDDLAQGALLAAMRTGVAVRSVWPLPASMT